MAKNYLTHDELDSLNRLAVIFLESAELRVKNHQDLTLVFWRKNVDALLTFNGFEVLDGYGNRSHRQAQAVAYEQYGTFHARRKSAKQKQADNEDWQELQALENELKNQGANR